MDVQSAREETIRAYQLHAGVLLAYAHRLTRDDALAQDALQETYLRFFLALVQGESIQNARAWLHRVAHNYVCDFLKIGGDPNGCAIGGRRRRPASGRAGHARRRPGG